MILPGGCKEAIRQTLQGAQPWIDPFIRRKRFEFIPAEVEKEEGKVHEAQLPFDPPSVCMLPF